MTVTPTIHLLLTHGPAIAEYLDGDIGQKTEEAIESSNKLLRSSRRHHSRQANRCQNLKDMIHWILEESDPLLNSINLA